ncbi:MAG: dTMP kinase [Actinomycetota bacterium]
MTFVVLEGGEGVGKSTQANALRDRLESTGRAAVVTHEPGEGAFGHQLRELLLHSDLIPDARAELYLLLADRAQHVSDVIRPALDVGTIVICDRYSPSSLAYQGVGRKLGVEPVERAAELATQGLEPDLVVVLDIPEGLISARQGEMSDRMEHEGHEFHAAVREAYRMLAPLYGWCLIDGAGRVDEVHHRVWAEVRKVLP